MKANGGGCFKLLQEIAHDFRQANSQAHYPHLHGPLCECCFPIKRSFPVHSEHERPMCLGYNGTFTEPSLSIAVKPWVNLLCKNKMGFDQERATRLLNRINKVFDALPISGVSGWAKSKKEKDKVSFD
jgi:hypothetical protein